MTRTKTYASQKTRIRIKSIQSARSAQSAWSARSAVCSLQSAWSAFWGDRAFWENSVNKFDCRAFSLFSLFETVTRGSQIKTLAIEPYCWDRSTFLKKHQIPSRSLKECFSGNPAKSPDCRAFIHSRFNLCTQL